VRALSLPFSRTPTRLERLLGKRRVRRLRRRLGVVALGAGVVLVKPAMGWARVGLLAGVSLVVVAALVLWAV
jgi:hypothetical protein